MMRSRCLMRLATTAILCTSASTSFAAESDAAGPHVGVAVGAVGGIARSDSASAQVTAVALNPTLHVDLGWRIDQRASIYVRGEIGGVILFNQAALYALGEWTPAGSWSFASGIGWDGMASYAMNDGCHICSNTWSAVSIPLIAGVDVTRWNRSALRVGFEAAPGFDPSTATLGWHAAVTFGWVLD
jgi:hypothetical protein